MVIYIDSTLGENTPFHNQILFGENGTYSDGVSGFLTSDGKAAKVLFNGVNDGNTTVITTSAVINSTVYEMDIMAGRHNQLMAVINDERLATQFTFNSAISASNPSDGLVGSQILSAQGNNSVSPTMRRLWGLGYI